MRFSLGEAINALNTQVQYSEGLLYNIQIEIVVMTAVVIGETDLSILVLSHIRVDHLKNMIKELVVRSHCACVAVKSLDSQFSET